MKQPAIIIDIDGTAADCNHRRKYLDDGQLNWKIFNDPELMMKDTPKLWCRDIANAFSTITYHCEYFYKIIYVSGRSEKFRKLTEEWLKKNHFPSSMSGKYMLYMRPNHDVRSDCVVKQEIYYQFIEPKYEVKFCIDDRQQVVDMWRSLGLTCLQCDKGDF